MSAAGRFYLRWVKTALWHSPGAIDLWAGLAGALLGIVDHYVPQQGLMTAFGWQVPIWAVGIVLIIRFLAAPYWMAKEDGALGTLILEYLPHHPELSHQYYHVTTHPESSKESQLHRISVTNNLGHRTTARLTVESVRNKLGHMVPFERQSLLSAETSSDDFTINNGQRIFFNVVAYYKGEPNVVVVCGRRNGERYRITDAPFTILISLTGEGTPQQKNYRFDFNETGDLIFEAR